MLCSLSVALVETQFGESGQAEGSVISFPTLSGGVDDEQLTNAADTINISNLARYFLIIFFRLTFLSFSFIWPANFSA